MSIYVIYGSQLQRHIEPIEIARRSRWLRRGSERPTDTKIGGSLHVQRLQTPTLIQGGRRIVHRVASRGKSAIPKRGESCPALSDPVCRRTPIRLASGSRSALATSRSKEARRHQPQEYLPRSRPGFAQTLLALSKRARGHAVSAS